MYSRWKGYLHFLATGELSRAVSDAWWARLIAWLGRNGYVLHIPAKGPVWLGKKIRGPQ